MAFSSTTLVVGLLIINLIAGLVAIALVLDTRRDAGTRLDRAEADVRLLSEQDGRLRAARRNTAERLLDIENELVVASDGVRRLSGIVATFGEGSAARGNAVQFRAWSDLCFTVHDTGGLSPKDVERLRGAIIEGCSVILGRGG